MATKMHERTVPDATERPRELPTYEPRTDIYERDDAIVIEAEMPGVSHDGVDIQLKDKELTIVGRTSSKPMEGYRRIETEFTAGDYRRTFRIEGINVDKIDATMRHGVLHIVLPKAEALQPRRIAIKEA
jgi:HSP20 family molecular chaperone IbpA